MASIGLYSFMAQISPVSATTCQFGEGCLNRPSVTSQGSLAARQRKTWGGPGSYQQARGHAIACRGGLEVHCTPASPCSSASEPPAGWLPAAGFSNSMTSRGVWSSPVHVCGSSGTAAPAAGADSLVGAALQKPDPGPRPRTLYLGLRRRRRRVLGARLRHIRHDARPAEGPGPGGRPLGQCHALLQRRLHGRHAV